MSKHTQGPWFVNDAGAVESEAEVGREIAEIVGLSHHTQSELFPIDGARANANLIAASPDMLVCLEAINNCYVVTDAINGQKMWLTHQSIIDMVQEAISKARGETKRI